MVRDAIDHKMALDICGALWPAVAFHIGAARIYRPRCLRDLAVDESVILRLATANRDIGLLGQVELPVANDQFDPQARIAFVKEVDQGRPLEAVRQDRSASHANGTGEALVARGKAALESRHRFGGGP
jgi:hypothetical protein